MAMITTVVATASLGTLAYVIWRKLRSPESIADRAKAAEASLALRQAVLSRDFLADSPSGEADTIRSVVMDWNVGGGVVATVASHEDGTTSMYYNSGGAILGAGSLPKVQDAARRFRQAAADLESQFRPVTEWPFPPDHTVVFYVVKHEQTFASPVIAEKAASSQPHAFFELGSSAQHLITAIRKSR